MPIQQIAECLIQLYNARDRTKQILYELTEMSDILMKRLNDCKIIMNKKVSELKFYFGQILRYLAIWAIRVASQLQREYLS